MALFRDMNNIILISNNKGVSLMRTNLIIGWIMVCGSVAALIGFIILLIFEGGLPGVGNLRAFIIIPFAFIYGLWCISKAKEQKFMDEFREKNDNAK